MPSPTYWEAGRNLIQKWEINENYAQAIPPGWVNRIDTLLADLSQLPEWNASTMVAQIKTKFGTLRVYLGYEKDVPDEISEKVATLVNRAEYDCRFTCENCGIREGVRTGVPRGTGWMWTLCGKHMEEKSQEMEERLNAR